ncbi:Protein of unknown function [Lactobacillus helveticus CIRM-BIA 951]
MKKII